jgi:two-component system cell cycle sensor histidine kinase/response regulator CckA
MDSLAYSHAAQKIIDALDDPAAIVDAGGVIQSANEPWRRLTRFAAKASPGESYFGVFSDDLIGPENAAAIRAVVASARERAVIEHVSQLTSGRWLLITATRVGDGEATLITHHDITQRKLALESLRVRESQLEDAQHLAVAGSFDWDLQTNEISWSGPFRRMWGFDERTTPAVELLAEHVHPDDRATMAEVERRIRSGQESHVAFSLRIIRLDGEVRLLESAARVVLEDGRATRVFGVSRDVTEEDAAAERLRTHAARETAIADLGRRALRERDLRRLFESSVQLVQKTLGVDFAGLRALRLEDNRRSVASAGFHSAIFEQLYAQQGLGEQAVYTLRYDEPVSSRDLLEEKRFTPNEYLIEAGIRSSVSVVVSGREEPFGVLVALARSPRDFTSDDVAFVQAVANVVAEAIERKRAEEALARSERAFREFFDRAPVSMYRATVDGDVLGANPAFARLAGFASVGDVLLHNMRDLYVDAAEREELVERCLHEGAGEGIVRWRRADGRIIRVALVWNAIYSEDGLRIVGWDAFAQDVTDRYVAEQALRSSEERYRAIFEHAFDAVVQGDIDGNVYGFNEEFCRIFGFSRGDLGRITRSDLMDVSEPTVTRMQEALRAQRRFRGEVRMKRADGSSFLGEVSASRYESRDGAIRSTIVVRDVTARRAAEDRIRMQAAMLDSVFHPVMATRQDGTVFYWNRAAEQAFGFTAADVAGRTIDELQLLIDSDPERIQARIATHEAWTGELALRGANGRPFPALLAISPIFDAEAKPAGVVVVATDIADLRMLEAQLEQANRVASLGNLAATVAHEFNNVLMGIAPFGEIVRMRAGADDRLSAAAHHIDLGVRRGKRVAQEILRYAQQSDPVLQSVVLRELIEDVAASWRTLADDQITLTLDLPRDELLIRADPLQLQQVFTNLIANARDAMPYGGPIRILAGVESSDARFPFGVVDRPESFVHVEVRDSGTGIEPDVLKHIFEPLFTTKRTGGTGLGLAIVHRIVESHGGAIFAESRAEGGTSFHLFVPLAGEAPVRRTVDTPARRDAIGPLLLVEDDAFVAAGMAALLDSEGIEAEIVGRGADAVPAIERRHPAAVLLDLNLPDVDGQDVYRAIAARWPELPVIFSTGHGDEAKLGEFLQRPNVTWLLKPYDFEALVAALDAVLHKV